MANYKPREYDDLEFHIEQWSDNEGRMEQLLLCSTNALMALAAWDKVVELRGTKRLYLRHRARVINRHVPDRLKNIEKAEDS